MIEPITAAASATEMPLNPCEDEFITSLEDVILHQQYDEACVYLEVYYEQACQQASVEGAPDLKLDSLPISIGLTSILLNSDLWKTPKLISAAARTARLYLEHLSWGVGLHHHLLPTSQFERFHDELEAMIRSLEKSMPPAAWRIELLHDLICSQQAIRSMLDLNPASAAKSPLQTFCDHGGGVRDGILQIGLLRACTAMDQYVMNLSYAWVGRICERGQLAALQKEHLQDMEKSCSIALTGVKLCNELLQKEDPTVKSWALEWMIKLGQKKGDSHWQARFLVVHYLGSIAIRPESELRGRAVQALLELNALEKQAQVRAQFDLLEQNINLLVAWQHELTAAEARVAVRRDLEEDPRASFDRIRELVRRGVPPAKQSPIQEMEEIAEVAGAAAAGGGAAAAAAAIARPWKSNWKELSIDPLMEAKRALQSDPSAAFLWARSALSTGDPAAKRLVGYMYLRGKGVMANGGAAIAWFRAAADGGDRNALRYLAVCHLNGEGVPHSPRRALLRLREALEGGDQLAQHKLSSLLGNGMKDVESDPEEAFHLLMELAKQSDGLAALRVGRAYFHGIGVKQSHRNALKWWIKAAEYGSGEGAYWASVSFGNGYGTHHASNSKKIKWCRQAAKLGYVDAQYEIFIHLKDSDTGESVEWLQRAAHSGHVNSSIQLAKIRSEEQTEKSLRQARILWEQAARAGKEIAMVELGQFCEKGLGGEIDGRAAFEWYKAAADKKYPDGYFNVARCYCFGIGVKRDRGYAEGWLRLQSRRLEGSELALDITAVSLREDSL